MLPGELPNQPPEDLILEPLRTDQEYRNALAELRASYPQHEVTDIPKHALDEFTVIVGGWHAYSATKLPTDRTPGRRRKVEEMAVMEKAFPPRIITQFNRQSLPSRAGVRKSATSISVRDEAITTDTLRRICDIELYAIKLHNRYQREQQLGSLVIAQELPANLTVVQQAVLSHTHYPRQDAAARLSMSAATFGAHIAHLRSKLDAPTIEDLTRIAYKQGYIPDNGVADVSTLNTFEYAIAKQYVDNPRQTLPELTGYTYPIIKETITSIYRKLGISTRRQLILAFLKAEKTAANP